jgi:hypothetical protein
MSDAIRGEDRLFGIVCADGGIIPCASAEQRDRLYEHMQKQDGFAGCRLPVALLRRDERGGEWFDDQAAAARPSA